MAKNQLKKTFLAPLGKDNPVFVQILGICSTLAVTNKLQNTMVMTLGVMFTTALSSWTISLLRNHIPSRIRMMVETMVIATFVIVVDIVLKAFFPDMWKQLGPYVGLIITNCIVMGRVEAFALQNKPSLSLIDGLASGLGYTYVLMAIAFVRELLGTGSLWGYQILGSWWTNWAIMIMPPGGFFMLAIFIWIVKEVITKEAKHV
ncbi:MAG: NADH:ubiquinone reductase (Na(+)-transporting) subunit D [Sphaerochaetaceae bacterium]|jgi:Na+-transporting NADH:ubiquinone oxidoreductase subunit D|nr:NADH:ubiquinone reductase (Na(+)-transporting) subunit D [Sphaerochaetaceae bacterium]NLO59957.1 NADH:ubiquinone reductase (Na(+)-transporting) subunit D [Spirochaetales bacterium]MDD2405114.1 NADH:ubiquinone reductase (Na(+)-transporting) subunit D [Sphaerochaetaceae bacterium]MDD3671788.1 NADH:ubiquinone reductase (Na(+)-transporting) subunit D [Sphaerochaetaceae bacterium]MDD4258966.1 NADH:ubiquinone reductase (Na(+)-transporting) subunit D [Sphaerochaetaceae bacterium]